MPGKFFKNILTKDKVEETSLQNEFSQLSDGIKRTDGTSTTAPVSLIGIVDSNNVRNKPGFTPNDSFNVINGSAQPTFGSAPLGWYGNLLDSHIDSVKFKTRKTISTEDKFRESKTFTDDKSTRDRYLIFNDSSQDYFRHGLAINGRTPIKTAKNEKEAWDGSNDRNYRLKTFKNTPYENEDPVMYGFEIIIDAISSPLLNGSVEDFIRSYSVVSEIQSRRIVLYDFKKQFEKIFKTKGNIYFQPDAPSSQLQSRANNAYAQAQSQKGEFRPGKKAYLSHYLQKIDGLDFLIERNDGSPESKSFVNYGTDKLTLSFTEDVSGTLATLSHLYKLLYWSRPNGKNIVPENLLRFNCEIVVCEVRNFNRVRKIVQSTPSKETLEIVKDNVSRYIYSLRECQLFFNQMSHEKTIDLSNIKMFGDAGPGHDVIMNFKYATTKYEKWVPDPESFGQYVGYNNGAIWKIGNKGAREERSTQKSEEGGTTGKIADSSNPRFYTVGTNTIRHNGVTTAIVLDKIDISPGDISDDPNFGPATGGNSVSGNSAGVADGAKGTSDISQNKKSNSTDQLGEDQGFTGPKSTKQNQKSGLDILKDNSKKVTNGLISSAKNFVVGEINNQIKIRAKLLENTINKIKLSVGLGGIEGSPKNVYPKPYTPSSFGPWFDVRKELMNFLTEDIAGLMGPTDPFQTSYSELNKLKPQNFGKSTNQIYNEKSQFGDTNQIKFGNSAEKNKVYGSLENIILTKSNPSESKNGFWRPIGEKDYSKIGFGLSNKGDHQKYPKPLSQGMNIIGILAQKLKSDIGYYTNLKYGFPRSFPNNKYYGSLENIIKNNSNPSEISSANGKLIPKPIGQKDFSKIGFGTNGYGDHQKFPQPLSSGQNLVGISTQQIKTNNGYYTNLKFGFPRSAPSVNYGTLENIIKGKSNPSQSSSDGGKVIWKPIGQKDYSKIGFGPNGYGDHQKFPAPVTQNIKKLEEVVKSNTKWSYPSNNQKFGKK